MSGLNINRKTIAPVKNPLKVRWLSFFLLYVCVCVHVGFDWQYPIWLSHICRTKQLNTRWMTATRHGKLLFNGAFRCPPPPYARSHNSVGFCYCCHIPSLQFSHLLNNTHINEFSQTCIHNIHITIHERRAMVAEAEAEGQRRSVTLYLYVLCCVVLCYTILDMYDIWYDKRIVWLR